MRTTKRLRQGLFLLLSFALMASGFSTAFSSKTYASSLPPTPMNQTVETVFTGTEILFDHDDDGISDPLPIGFDFNFYGTSYSEIYASTNGLLMFSNPSYNCCDSSSSLPFTGIDHFITPFYDDLYVKPYSKVFYTTIGDAPNRKFVIQYTNMGMYNTGLDEEKDEPFGTVQAILYESTNEIQYQYPNLIGINYDDLAFGSDALIGIQSLTGEYVTYSQTTKSLTEKQAIRFTPNTELSSYIMSGQAGYEPILLKSSLFPDSPALISPADGSKSVLNPTFHWNHSNGATSYRLLVATDPEFLSASIVVDQSGITENSFVVNGLQDGTTYYWKAVAINNNEFTFSNTNRFAASSLSSNTNLSALSLSGITLDQTVSESVYAYTATVPNNVTVTSVTYTTEDNNATVSLTLNENPVSNPINLNVGQNVISILVTAQDNSQTVYSVTVTRISNNALLSSLSIDQGTLSPAFSSSVLNYTVNVPNAVSSLNFSLSKGDPNQMLAVTGADYTSVTGDVYSYSASNLREGSNPIQIAVTAQDGTSINPYTLTVMRVSDSSSDFPSTGNPGGATVPTGPTNQTGISVTINGKTEQSIAAATVSEQNGKTVLTVTVNADMLMEQLANAGDMPVVVIPVTSIADKVTAVLTGGALKALENKNAILEIQTPIGSYKLPASEVLIDQLAQQLGAQTKLSDIIVHVDIAKSDGVNIELLKQAADKGGFTVMVPPVDFTVTAAFDNKTVNVNKFNSYVEREISLPDRTDASKLTTAVVLNEDGTTRSVPTDIIIRGGKSYAIINSLTNSTYALIWNPLEFSDVANHWAKDVVNDMGSRMVINGTGNGLFSPDRDITRAEFAAIIVRGLGLKLENGATSFTDVKITDWYSGAVATAHSYQLINGFEDGTFRPNDKITREQAMTIIESAMNITDLKAKFAVKTTEELLTPFIDADTVAGWAKNSVADCLQAGIVTGRSSTELAPKAHMTRAEVAAIVQRLLQKSELI